MNAESNNLLATAPTRLKKIGIVAGEASGDVLGARLIHALRERYPDIQFEGIGGPAMDAAGCDSLFDIERLAVMGFIEPFFRLPDLIFLRRQLYQHFTQHRPDVFIGIDAPDFNIGLEFKLRQAGIPVVHYVSPSVWAWRQKRIHKIAKAVDLMLTLLPFEEAFYKQHAVPVHYVGHPLAEQLPLQADKIAARRSLCLDEQAVYVALLPGSRSQEIRHMAQPFLLAAHRAWRERPYLHFITSQVNELRYQEFYDSYKRYTPDLPLQFFTQRSHDVMTAANMAIVTSGTATLETMLCKTPMVIAYRMGSLTYRLAQCLVKTPFIGLPNLLANKMLVPELIQDAVNPESIARHLLDYVDHPEKVKQTQAAFHDLHSTLRMDSSRCIAEAVLGLMASIKT